MACRRLTFTNGRVFEIVIESTDVAGELSTSVCTAVIYRVTRDARESKPIQRTDGGPLTIIATNEYSVLNIARHVLSDVTGATLDTVSNCGTHSLLPPCRTWPSACSSAKSMDVMREPACPACGVDIPRRLDGTSADTDVWVWRCDYCGHIWTVSKADETNVQHITPLPPEKDRAG